MLRKRKKTIIITTTVILTLALFDRIGVIRSVQAKVDDIYNEIKVFTEVFMLVKNNYVEEVDTKKLIYGAAKGMIKTLDPFSQFMEPTVNEIMKSDAEGFFGGLGIRIAIKDEVLTVITPLLDTPAYKAGILPEDKIIKIEGEPTYDLTLSEVIDKLRGDKGTKVTISIQREGVKDLIDYTIVRDIIKLESVPEYRMLNDKIGYIRLTEFTKSSTADFDKAIKELKDKNMQSLIFDLRFNPGGLLNVAVDICKYFVGDKKIIVYTKGRRTEQDMKFYADETSKVENIPLIVLVNGGSASGSEIVAGCIKDWRRGIILGQKTFGKASVQSVIPLSDGSGLRLTTAHYYTPSGALIHEKGIEPDIDVKITKDEMISIMKDKEKIFISPDAKKPESKDKKTIKEAANPVIDIQLERAKEILMAKEMLNLPELKTMTDNPDLNKQ